jgi:NhaP-type Na+/H+ or K+/H+ antiporter
MTQTALETIALAVLLGVAGQVMATTARMPAIVFLLLLGVLAGPHVAGVVAPKSLGPGLPLLTEGFVAVILFEGALTLRPRLLRESFVPVRRLITRGAVVTFVGAAVLAHFVGGLPWPVAFLFGSLVIVTGPTVIAPILRRVRLTPRLHSTLKAESILIDPVGVIVAAVTFEYVVAGQTSPDWGSTFGGMAARLGLGTALGCLAGALMAGVVRLPVFRRATNEHLIGLGGLGLALGTYTVCQRLLSGTGIPAVIAAGLVLAAAPIPFRDELERFKDRLTTLGVSVLFILLAANLNLELLSFAGWREAALLAGVIFLVRPLAVAVSTAGTDLTWRERSYLALIAPRGILAAAMASHFAEALRLEGLPGGNRLETLVFLTIGATVLLQGGWAGPLAGLLKVRRRRPEGVLLVGVNEWSLAVAEELRRDGRPVQFLDDNPVNAEPALAAGFEVAAVNATDPTVYDRLDLSPFGTLVAMTPNDAVNALTCRAAAGRLGEEGVARVLSRPPRSGEEPRELGGGRWAMPTALSHRRVCRMLRSGRLLAERRVCPAPTPLAAGAELPDGVAVPFLVIARDQIAVAVAGEVCPPGATLVGARPVGHDDGLNGDSTAALELPAGASAPESGEFARPAPPAVS